MSHDRPGAGDVERAVAELSSRLPEPLHPLARLAYNYWWSWAPGGRDVFAAIDERRFAATNDNPIRFLRDLTSSRLEQAANDPQLVGDIAALGAAFDRYMAADAAEHPVAFFCAEFAVHPSLAIYSGGLGVLAGDILKEASDRDLPCVGVGLCYRRGYFHQRLDPSGYQHEYWTAVDPESLPAVLVTRDGAPGRSDRARVGRARRRAGVAGRRRPGTPVPPRLRVAGELSRRSLDHRAPLRRQPRDPPGAVRARSVSAAPACCASSASNRPWSTSTKGTPRSPRWSSRAGNGRETSRSTTRSMRVRERVVFTTHTPVAAGNETYETPQILDVFSGICREVDVGTGHLLDFGRVRTDDSDERAGMTPLAIRAVALDQRGRAHGTARSRPRCGGRSTFRSRT